MYFHWKNKPFTLIHWNTLRNSAENSYFCMRHLSLLGRKPPIHQANTSILESSEKEQSEFTDEYLTKMLEDLRKENKLAKRKADKISQSAEWKMYEKELETSLDQLYEKFFVSNVPIGAVTVQRLHEASRKIKQAIDLKWKSILNSRRES